MSKRRGLSIDADMAGVVTGTPPPATRRTAPQPAATGLPPGTKNTRKQDSRGNWIRSTFVELPEEDWLLMQAVALKRARPGERPSMKAVLVDLVAAARAGLERELKRA